MGKKKHTTNSLTEAATPNETRTEAEGTAPSEGSKPTPAELAAIPEPDPVPTKSQRRKKSDPAPVSATTLADIAAGYLAHMESEGRSDGTTASYGMELKTAMAELGGEMPVADLAPERVQEYFDCMRVTRLRNGKAKSQLSIDKTRRVLRLALVWAAKRGIIAKAPIPDALANA